MIRLALAAFGLSFALAAAAQEGAGATWSTESAANPIPSEFLPASR